MVSLCAACGLAFAWRGANAKPQADWQIGAKKLKDTIGEREAASRVATAIRPLLLDPRVCETPACREGGASWRRFQAVWHRSRRQELSRAGRWLAHHPRLCLVSCWR